MIERQGDDLIPRQHLVRMAHEGGQERSLPLAQRHRLSIHGHAAGSLVDFDMAAGQHLLNSALDATQHRVGARNQLARIEGLDDVVVGATLQPDHPLSVRLSGCQHDDRDVGLLTQGLTHVHPVHTRQHQVQDDQVRRELTGARQAGNTIVRNLGGKPGPLKVHLHPSRDARIVFNDQDAAVHVGSSTSPAEPRRPIQAPRLPADGLPPRLALATAAPFATGPVALASGALAGTLAAFPAAVRRRALPAAVEHFHVDHVAVERHAGKVRLTRQPQAGGGLLARLQVADLPRPQLADRLRALLQVGLHGGCT